MRPMRMAAYVAAFLLMATACNGHSAVPAGFEVTDAKTCLSVDAERRPLTVASEFPAGTRSVYCWFAWKNARPGLQLTTRWYYETEQIQILALSVALTRIADHGVLSLTMPEGKVLPPGSYRVELGVRGKVVKSVPFTVRSASSASSAQAPAGP